MRGSERKGRHGCGLHSDGGRRASVLRAVHSDPGGEVSAFGQVRLILFAHNMQVLRLPFVRRRAVAGPCDPVCHLGGCLAMF